MCACPEVWADNDHGIMDGLEKKRILLEISYDGTMLHGFAFQDGVRTVEGELNKAISGLERRELAVIGASRTDTGVHALKNVAVFDSFMNIEDGKYAYAINSKLPEDIRIRRSYAVSGDFHPRHCGCEKTYVYTILNDRIDVPLRKRYTHFVPVTLNEEAMQRAGRVLVGEHDFKSFCSVHTQARDTVRHVTAVDVLRKDREISIQVKGRGFLYNMVRIIAGTLIEAGKGSLSEEDVRIILETRDRTKAGPTAPAKGLCLVDIKYDVFPGLKPESLCQLR